ncbi:MAG: ribokinase [Hespellia sp.]|nr:ribokinase [Hespellia sp.]
MIISVVGSINMDMTVVAERIPQKGETLVGSSISYIPGGKGANQAVAMAKLGANVRMFGCVGDDNSGETLINNLKKYEIDTRYIQKVPDVETGTAFITVGENDNTIVVVAGANNCVDCNYVDNVKDNILESDLVVLQHEIPIETVEYVTKICHENRIKVILNPAPAHPISADVLEMVDYITPNEHEAVNLFGDKDSTEELLGRYPEKLIITQGSRGVSFARESGEAVNVPARPAKVADTTGAGDTLNGAFAVQISKGVDIEEALRFANVAASLSTERFGAQGGMPKYEEVMKAM